jgi:1-piperideine-2-carboxylate/1-pyrroline-2-carboxylate reductase [NAD(P)H]
MQLFSAVQTAEALPYAKLVATIKTIALQFASGEVRAPERQVIVIDADSVLLTMPAIGRDIGITKLITVHGNNARHRLPAIQGEVIVFDTGTGRRIALLDGPTVTARRTAAVSLLGIDLLARAKPASALLIGTGVQAAAHADALADYFGIADFRIAGRDAAKLHSFCASLRARMPAAAVQAVGMAEVPEHAAQVDLVIALTTATSPVIPAQIGVNTLAIGVGAFKPEMAELPAELLRTRPVVVDHLAGARHEAGDLLRANIDWSKARDIASMITGAKDTRDVIPVLKTVGHSAWDLAAARVAIERIG